ncbi:YigZ family protein [Isoptericola sp. AK164]|uniref:IMPACT family protein n=1 Tax=Isoptericola sp. AK164 TaxID=3024246 RepID=UPI00241837DA|nr:YigZ family protein [Isoptericola sp. AK164]
MSSPLPRTLATAVDHELVVKKSRFLAHLAPATTEAAADAVVAAVRKQHWDARHHCVAMVRGTHADAQRSSDDGEPSGTAGVPMLEVLRQQHLTDVVAVVTRYFGGVLLGAGGLVRAYSAAVAGALEEAASRHVILERRAVREVWVDAPHADAGRVDHSLRDWSAAHGAVVGDPEYAEVARLRLLVPPTELDRLDADLAAATAGRLAAQVGAERIVDVPPAD